MSKRLYRSRQSKIFGGVAGGLGEYFDVDPVFVRAIFVAFTLAWGAGLLIYIVLWIITPLRVLSQTAVTDNGLEVGFEEIEAEPTDPKVKERRGRIAAFLLIIAGSLLFLNNVIESIQFWDIFPLGLIAIGGYLLYFSFKENKENNDYDEHSEIL